MDKFEKYYRLHKMLATARQPVPRKLIEEELECSKATVTRMIRESRDYLQAPIERHTELNGYYYDTRINPHYELPGLWFNASELHALLVAHQLLAGVKPGFLEPHIAPLKKRILTILKKEKYDEKRVFDRVRILKQAARDYNLKHFALVTTALLNDHQLEIDYYNRSKDLTTQRKISPQRLVHYRDNWYLDAWCHTREALRTFSVDCIQQTKLASGKSIYIDEEMLNKHYAEAYGIFAGKAKHIAELRFSKSAARWVVNEQWHPEQSGQHEVDGQYTLKIPYGDPRELIMDILKYGNNVEVVGPISLRNEVIQRLTQALIQYKEQQ